MDKNRKPKSVGRQVASGFDRVTGRIRSFFSNTIAELGRCTWPGKTELFESTILVIVVIGILALYVAGVDEVARRAIRFVTTGRF